MSDTANDNEIRFIKLLLSTVLKTIEAVHEDVDAHETVRQHMLDVCSGVRQRALAAAGANVSPEQATLQVDALTSLINDYIDYSASPASPAIELVRRDTKLR